MKTTIPLTRNGEFQRLYKRGASAVGSCMVIYCLPRRRGEPHRKPMSPPPRVQDAYSRSKNAPPRSKNAPPRSKSAHPPVPTHVVRLGLTASAKLGKAVYRNRIRRRIKECYRRLETKLRPGHDLVIVARTRAYSAPFSQLEYEMQTLFVRLHMMEKSEL